MNRHNQQNSLTPKALIYRIVITVTALFIVCLYMPRDERSTYQFDVGKPWLQPAHRDLRLSDIQKRGNHTDGTGQYLTALRTLFRHRRDRGERTDRKVQGHHKRTETGHHTGQLSGIRGKQTGTYLRAGRHGHGEFRPNAQR